ncbi:MAG: GTP 3',8-cyclase MoaA [Myxococcota bacterium]
MPPGETREREERHDRLGRPMRDLRISVTDRCSFRCPYCMPAELFGERYEFLPRRELLTFEEIERLARIFASLGVRKLRLTGGEPLLRAQLPRLIERLAAIEGVEDLALTTNGLRLPSLAQALRDAGLQRVTISLDSLDEEVFARMSGGKYSVSQVLEGIEAAERAGLRPIKLNCVVQRGVNDHTLVELVRHFRGRGPIVRFIEFMDVGTLNDWNLARVVSAREILAKLRAEMPLHPVAPSTRGEVARYYALENGGGEIGLISSVTQPFCGDCTRARLTPDGQLVTCLFASAGIDLKGPLRGGASDDVLCEMIAGCWAQRADRYSELRSLQTARQSGDRWEMYRIGG